MHGDTQPDDHPLKSPPPNTERQSYLMLCGGGVEAECNVLRSTDDNKFCLVR